MAELTESVIRSKLLEKSAADDDFRAQLVADPRSAVEREFSVTIPEGFSIEVHEEDATNFHLVLPPLGGRLGAGDLAALSGGGDGSNTSINPW